MESAELIAILREVRERVRAQHPQGSAPGNLSLPDLLPLVHARDAALGKVAAIGTVNPRRGGVVNAVIQRWKRLVARLLDWHVREQVVFNRQVIDCIDAAIEALNENNRAVTELASRIAAAHSRAEELLATRRQDSEEVHDIRQHWTEWRAGWEQKLRENEVQFLRSVADLQAAFQHRLNLMDAGYRETVKGQHTDFTARLEKTWNDIERMRLDFERLIFTELRLIRQRTAAEPAPAAPPVVSNTPPAGAALDYGRFAERFRGSEEYVKAGQQIYRPYFTGRKNVLDIGCGRGEFLEMMRSAGVSARGIDLSHESVALCRQKGLDAEVADLFAYLAAQPAGSFDGIFCAQVVEHLPPERLPEMIRLAARSLAPEGTIAIETPNPECLAIFATHFYLDPTHTRPVPHPLLAFYLEEFGVATLEVRRLSPAVESFPALAPVPDAFREAFFGGLDYAIIGRKL